MLKKLWAMHKRMEDESLAVLQDPSLAEKLPPGFRRLIGLKLATLSPFERQQLHAFSLKYYGWRAYAAIGKFIVLCTALGVALHLAFPKYGMLEATLLANALGLAGLAGVVGAWYNHSLMLKNKLKVIGGLLGMAIVGNIVGASVAGYEKGRTVWQVIERLPPVIAYTTAGLCLCLLLPLGIVVMFRNQHYQIWAAQLQMDAEKERAARELSESKLRLLRAQIEPHFLFNTLGAVQQLAEQGAPRAAELTANLIAFLRASLSEMRTDSVTLSGDFRLIEAYLQVMKARLGDRLCYSLHLPPELASVSVPSMMLLTLVENAIKHGIEPALRGGAIRVVAERLDAQVRIRVQDSGVGMSVTPGCGDGLANVRARLQLTYGAAASLSLADAEPQGLEADILIPIEPMKA
jgi:signal transduction histidine kinase